MTHLACVSQYPSCPSVEPLIVLVLGPFSTLPDSFSFFFLASAGLGWAPVECQNFRMCVLRMRKTP